MLSSRKNILANHLIEIKSKKIVKNGFVFYETASPKSLLEWAIQNGYVLHGTSTAIIGALEPRKSNDIHKEFGNKKAVYMTSIPLTAMFKAFAGGVDTGASQDTKQLEITDNGVFIYRNVHFAVQKPENLAKSGYIYIFANEQTDENEGSEYVSYKPIEPLTVIQVYLRDFGYKIQKLDVSG